MRVSVIIPSRARSQYLAECLSGLSNLVYDDYEVIVLSDEPLDLSFPRTRIIATGKLSPSRKRNIGAQLATGDVVAFLDDDAYPEKDWLLASSRVLAETSAGAVCGPAIGATSDNPRERAASAVMESLFVSGPLRYRFVPSHPRAVDDYPTCNLLVRKSVFDQAGGFDPTLYPGEDTELCLRIGEGLQQKIIYHPSIVVYHHRRPLFIPHLTQVGSYAAMRGYFAKAYPKTSRRLHYFLPSALVVGWILALLGSIWLDRARILLAVTIVSYVVATIATSRWQKSRVPVWMIAAGIPMTHIWYGLRFMWGLLVERRLVPVHP